MKKTLVLVLLLCAAFWESGCRIVVTSEPRVRVFRSERLIPEGWYETIHGAMQSCTGKVKPYAGLEWFQVGARRMGQIERHGEVVDVAGLFSKPHRIYLDERYVMDASVVAHEILHYLTDEGDTPLFDDILQACGVW